MTVPRVFQSPLSYTFTIGLIFQLLLRSCATVACGGSGEREAKAARTLRGEKFAGYGRWVLVCTEQVHGRSAELVHS
ncbi:hypothetical protein BDP27DRAFT_1343169 [Rhodocollybia butyracea]|uniref:Secreted protein n=1 Tax=Rhodocollybia butyracea TaxID=206335 RepID=A0A9P5TXC9_9AGAR|nr:hypothetical protein BDP27DRAFT_1343169 [Rhodocollybia butyracea]